MSELSPRQQQAMGALAKGEWRYFYELEADGVRYQTLLSLQRRGFVEMRFHGGAISGPRSNSMWRDVERQP